MKARLKRCRLRNCPAYGLQAGGLRQREHKISATFVNRSGHVDLLFTFKKKKRRVKTDQKATAEFDSATVVLNFQLQVTVALSFC